MDSKKGTYIFLIIIYSVIATAFYIRGHSDGRQDLKYYKEKSEKEQRLLWRVSYTFPDKWDTIKNTPEYHQCRQYEIETLQ